MRTGEVDAVECQSDGEGAINEGVGDADVCDSDGDASTEEENNNGALADESTVGMGRWSLGSWEPSDGRRRGRIIIII